MKPALPPSATDLPTSLLGFGMGLAAIAYFRLFYPQVGAMEAAIAVMVATALPNLFADIVTFRRHHEASAHLGADRPVNWREVARKCAGLAATFAGFALLYAVLPEYDAPMYQQALKLLGWSVPVLLLASPFYFAWCLKHLEQPWDGYDEMTELLRGRLQGRDWREIGRHWRNWAVKGFFLPLMLSFMLGSVQGLVHFNTSILTNFMGFFVLAYAVIMMGDLVYAAVGYVLTLRPLNAHIKSSEPTVLGWLVAVMCYPPFWDGVMFGRYFNYMNGPEWTSWLAGTPWLLALWGATILLLLAVYSLATMCLGIRFSNLTYRGLVTSGPYRFTKHPAYVTKNLSWWLISIPFMRDDIATAATHCLLLLGVNMVYYLRALTEERHLSNYPEYVEYALAMNERSIFRGLVKWLPFLKYKVPANIPRI